MNKHNLSSAKKSTFEWLLYVRVHVKANSVTFVKSCLEFCSHSRLRVLTGGGSDDGLDYQHIHIKFNL